jgi:nucleotide-binding universal stress UspA family protein
MFKNILVATDGSKLSARAVDYAIRVATCFDAKLTVCFSTTNTKYGADAASDGVRYVANSETEYEQLCRKEAAHIFAAVARKTKAAGVKSSIIQAVAAAPWLGILATGKKSRCDLIIMASHGRRGVSALLLGSETQRVLTHATVPVIVIR